MKPALPQVLSGQGPILLDFDGPVCDIFSNYTNASVSSELRAVLLELGTPLPDSVVEESDPLEILRWAATLSRPALTHAVEDTLCMAELRAASTATSTPGARELLSACQDRERLVGIVSNNSSPAIEAYVHGQNLTAFIALIVGREPYRPDRMKPNPEPVMSAVTALGAQPRACVLIGDSLSDIIAARAAGVSIISYANKPFKKNLFIEAGSDAVVTSMFDVATEISDLQAAIGSLALPTRPSHQFADHRPALCGSTEPAA